MDQKLTRWNIFNFKRSEQSEATCSTLANSAHNNYTNLSGARISAIFNLYERKQAPS